MKKIIVFPDENQLDAAVKLQKIGLIRIHPYTDLDLAAVIPNDLDDKQLHFDLKKNGFIHFNIDYGDGVIAINKTRCLTTRGKWN